MNDAIEIRNFNLNDVEYIYNNWAENPNWQGCNFKKDYNSIKDLIKQWETKKYNNVYFEQFLIVYQNKLVGMISLFEHSSEEVSVGVFVDLFFRNKGIATMAYKLIEDVAKNKNYNQLTASVLDNNVPSLNFHKKLGFKEVDRYYNKNGKLQIKFSKNL